ncbi:MAG: hypothetical protein Q8L55_08760 [Phycisphaerales bacterium]|nr:hypothetical protein [Phycisphaerales bacterium]
MASVATTMLALIALAALAPTAHAQWTVTNLHPAGATYSSANAASGGQQAGTAALGNFYHAGWWSATAASWVDLHVFVPAEYTSSSAGGVSSDATYLYVTGSGHNSLTGQTEGLLWTRPLPPSCPADFNHDSVVDFFDYLEFVQVFSVRC